MSENTNKSLTTEERRIQKLKKNQKNHKQISQMYAQLYQIYKDKLKDDEEKIKKQLKQQQKQLKEKNYALNPSQPSYDSSSHIFDSQPQKTKKYKHIKKPAGLTESSIIGEFSNLDLISENFETFEQLDSKLKKELFGIILLPKLKSIVSDTGIPSIYEHQIMDILLDFNAFNTNDIIDILSDEIELEERIEEAHQIILSGGGRF